MSRQTMLRGLVTGLALISATTPLAAQGPVDDAQVTVQNNRDESVTVYLDAQPIELTLGTVEPLGTTTFDLPRHLVTEHETVRLLLRPEGGLLLEAQGIVTDETPRLALMVPSDEEEDLEVMSGERVADVLAGRDVAGATVTVRNAEDEAAEVYLMAGTLSHRLGRVGPESVTTFVIPASMAVGEAEIMLAPDGEPPVVRAIPLHATAHVGVDL